MSLQRCATCQGKARRKCPAMKGLICAQCCGRKRGSELDCPPECPHFPFGVQAYDLWLKVDLDFTGKLLAFVAGYVDEPDFRRLVGLMLADHESSRDIARSAAMVVASQYCLTFRRGPEEGMGPLIDAWEATGWEGLNNDERVMMRYRRHTHPAVLEIQRPVNDLATECVDLLEPERGSFRLFDRIMAKRVSRYATLVTWITHFPNFSRPLGVASLLPRDAVTEFLRRLQEDADDFDGIPMFSKAIDTLAQDYGPRLVRIQDDSIARMKSMMESMDSHGCIAAYEIVGDRDRVKAILDERPEFEACKAEDAEEGSGLDYRWLRVGESKAIEAEMPAPFRHRLSEDGVGSIGKVRLEEKRFLFEAMTKQLYNFGKEMIERIFGDELRFGEQAIVDIAKQIAQRGVGSSKEPSEKSDSDPGSEIPEELQRELKQKFYRRYYEKFLDDDVPMLGGMTPRQATGNPEMRQKLIDLMKIHIHGIDEQNRSGRLNFSIDWVLKELGLDDLI